MSGPTRQTPDGQQPGQGIYDMELPLNPDSLRRNARAHGFSDQEADVLAQLALQKLREAMASSREGEPVTALQIVEAIKQHAAEEAERERERERQAVQREVDLFDAMCEQELGGGLEREDGDFKGKGKQTCPGAVQDDSAGPSSKRCKFTDGGLEEYFGPGEDAYALSTNQADASFSLKHHGMDLITALCQRVELAVELAKHLGPEDLLKLYSMSRAFHDSLDGHLLSSIRQILAHRAAEAGKIFQFKLYRRLLVPDPAGRTWEEQLGTQSPGSPSGRSNKREVRSVPGLRYLQLVLVRDRCCRDILAVLARHGHRMPPGMYKTLLRMWLLMDVSTSHQRRALLRNQELWTDVDLYNAQLFIVKLGMHFNDPIYGPLTFDIPSLILGQKGLYFLWQVLMRKRFTTPEDILDAKVRYDFEIPQDGGGHDFFDLKVYGVPFCEVGIGHMEGWGRGRRHLMRPDELVPYEAVVRGLELDEHLMHMMTWGYFDWHTGENLVPTEDEMYISDEERVLAHMDTSHLWQRKHALKKRWDTLTPEQQRKIRADDEDDALRALAWASDPPSDTDAEGEDKPPTLDDEITRGFIIPPQKPRVSGPPKPPSFAGTMAAWAELGTQVLLSLPVELQGDQLLRAEAMHNYRAPSEEPAAAWDWEAWLEQEGQGCEVDAAEALDDGDMSSSGETEEDAYMAGDEDDFDSGSERDENDDDVDDAGQHEVEGIWNEADLEKYIEDFFDQVVIEDSVDQGHCG
ncbi:putative histidine kinase group protein [Hirsutella rhossiliensis]|uniref:Histidine kinase group protein n=1 Tax=Hirsutella rhossiliensis TaxID=111463 RepID=A0A9P8N5R5_9HYPO|nr:putative histidine kinase group protein [Hirsutella rhossiliensis]KAH0965142.1 putative histidine kinase group protein [Hirsutella rhossiliensis]